MSEYLRHLAERSLGMADVARAVVPPLYADWGRAGPREVPVTLGSEGPDDLEVVTEELSRPQEARRSPRRARPVEPVPKEPETADTRSSRLTLSDRATDDPRTGLPAAEVLELSPALTRARRETRLIEPVETPTPEVRTTPLTSAAPAPASTATEPVVRLPEAGARSVTAAIAVPARLSIPPVPRRSSRLPTLETAQPVEARRTTLAPVGAPLAPIPRVVVPRPGTSTRAPASARGPDGMAMPAQDRIVEISIGRIEVRATPGPAREQRAPAPRPTLSLDAYLQGRAREGRR